MARTALPGLSAGEMLGRVETTDFRFLSYRAALLERLCNEPVAVPLFDGP